MGAPVRVTADGALVAAFLVGSVFVARALALSQPLDPLATPTRVCVQEIEVVAAVFLASIAVMQPAKDAMAGSRSSVSRLMRLRVELPRPVRSAALVVFVGGSFAFAFWAIADVLGGYNGYGYSFSTYPVLALTYKSTIGLVPYLSSLDKGTQASFYLSLAILGLVAYRLDRGIGAALKDTVTLFAAPCLVAFELALWHYAPEDMTWHVTDFLWIGGVNDGGYGRPGYLAGEIVRKADVAGGPYLVSNWLVLFVALVLVASRAPWMSLPSKLIWRRKRSEL